MEHCLTSEVPEVLIEYSRLRDLTIVPMPERDYLDQWYAESVIFGSGRPTVIVPHERKRSGSFALGTVIVAWDFSRAATRAMADAMPILEKAKHVCVLTVTKEKAIDTRRSGAELAKHLATWGRRDPRRSRCQRTRQVSDIGMPIFWSWGCTDTLGSENLFLAEPPRACLRVRPRQSSCPTDGAAIEGEPSRRTDPPPGLTKLGPRVAGKLGRGRSEFSPNQKMIDEIAPPPCTRK